MTVNRKIWGWFDAGKIGEALEGKAEFFLPDVTYRDEHDQVLVIDQLFDWAKRHGRERQAAEIFEYVVTKAAGAGELVQASRLLLTYLVVENDREDTIGVDVDSLAENLATVIKRHPGCLVNDEQTRGVVLAVADRLPHFKNLLDLH
jgi:hypothetical protein